MQSIHELYALVHDFYTYAGSLITLRSEPSQFTGHKLPARPN